ncbi:hypothetical protein ABT263_12300 [Kitasatospora sp. NPDC001603]
MVDKPEEPRDDSQYPYAPAPGGEGLGPGEHLVHADELPLE